MSHRTSDHDSGPANRLRAWGLASAPVACAGSVLLLTSGPSFTVAGFLALVVSGAWLTGSVINATALGRSVRASVVVSLLVALGLAIPTLLWNFAESGHRLEATFALIERDSNRLLQLAEDCRIGVGASDTGPDRGRELPPVGLISGAETWLRVDRVGEVLGWSGPDLRHPLPTDLLRNASATAQLITVSSATAVTRIGVSAAGAGDTRCLVARSDSTSRLPVAAHRGRPPERRQRQWAIRPIDSLQADSLDDLWFERKLSGVEEGAVLRIRRDAETRRTAPRSTALWVGLGLLCLFCGSQASQLAGWLAGVRGSWLPLVSVPTLGAAGATLWWGMGGSEPQLLAQGLTVLVMPLLLSALWHRAGPESWRGSVTASVFWRALVGLAGGVSVALLVHASGDGSGQRIGEQILADLDIWLLRLLCVAILATWVSLGRRRRGTGAMTVLGGLLPWTLAVALALGSAVWFETPTWRLAGALLASLWAGVATLRAGRATSWELSVIGVTTVALSVAIATQELKAASALRDSFESERAIVDAESAEEFLLEIDRQVRELPIEALVVGHPDGLDDASDLALAYWEATSLVDAVGLSALAVTDRNGALVSRFSYGLPLQSNEASLDPASGRWQGTAFDDWWDHAVAHLQTPLFVAGQPWGTLHLWAVPLLRTPPTLDRPETGVLAEDLLLGSKLNAWRLPLDAALVVRSADDGRRRLGVGRWQEIELPTSLGSAPAGAPGDGSRTIYRRPVEGLGAEIVLAVPRTRALDALLGPLTASTAVIAATGISVALLILTVLLLKPELRLAVAQAVLTYSRKLILVVVGVAVLPLALFNGFFFQSTQQRSQVDQRTAGETGLRAAERLVGEYLPNLRPGYSLSELFEDQLLDWLPEVVGNEINVYWRSRWQASSRPELAVTGVVPRILPSEIARQLEQRPGASAVRRPRTGVEHNEIYRRLLVDGDDSGFVLSLPLLAQSREAAASFERLAQQSLVLTTLLLLILSALGRRLAQNFSGPLEEVVEGTVAISEGAGELDLEPREPELATLVRAVDVMARRISSTRIALQAEKELLGAVLDHVPSAVFAVDQVGEVVLANPEARRLLDVHSGSSLAEVMAVPPLDCLGADFTGPQARHQTVTSPGEERREAGETPALQKDLQIAWVPLAKGEEGDDRFRLRGVLIAEDVTEILRGQRARAWAQMARMIAHEIKNPLTPIRLSAEHLRNVRRRSPERLDEVFDACVDNILEQVTELRKTATEFAAIDRLPSLDRSEVKLRETVDGVVDAYRHLPDVVVRSPDHEALDRWPVPHDRRMIGRVLRNLIENAISAIRSVLRGAGGEAGESAESRTGEIVLRSSVEADQEVVITVCDDGPGVAAAELERIFEPNFSSRSGGTGLGLAISRRIAEQHGGSLRARLDETGSGLQVELRLPLAPSGVDSEN